MSSPGAPPPGVPIPGIQAIAGPLLLGYLFNWALYGALGVQVYIYYMAFPKDKLYAKCLVFGLFTLDTLQSILLAHDAFNSYANNFGSLAELADVQLIWLSVPILSGIISCTVQMFFAYRIFALSHSKALGIVVALLALTQAVGAIVQGVQAKILGNFPQLQTKAFVSCTIWLAGSALCDVIIAFCMCFFLARKNTAFKQTQIIVNRLIRLTIETGTLTATIATVDIILFLVFRSSNYHTVPALTLGKLYSNTLLMVFNSRIRITGGREETEVTEMKGLNLGSTQPQSMMSRSYRSSNLHGQTDTTVSVPANFVKIQRTVETDADEDSMTPKRTYVDMT